MSSGGGDGGASARQAQIEAQKQAARDRLNLIFGEAPAYSPTVDKSQFTTYSAPEPGGKSRSVLANGSTAIFDKEGYDAAVAKASAGLNAEAEANKAAREKIYSDVRANAFTAGKRRVDEQNDNAARKLKFSLFAQGLNGGSTDIDQNALLKRTYDNGLLDLGAKADSAAAGVRSSDESTRLGLLQSIDAGTDQGSAISSALNQMKINSDRAAAEAQGTDVGDLFANVPLLYQNSQRAQGVADARDLYRYGSGSKSTGKAYSGQITPTN